MARKPRAQPSPDAAAASPAEDLAATGDMPVPARRGRMAKAAAPSPEPPPAVSADTAAGEPPRRGGANRKPKPPGAAAAAHDGQDAAPASPPEAAASAGPVQVDAGPGSPGGDAQQSSPGLHAPAPAKPAAQWDRATDTVRFDWPAIERTAAANGPNQGMARLLLAARADGANSRWPL